MSARVRSDECMVSSCSRSCPRSRRPFSSAPSRSAKAHHLSGVDEARSLGADSGAALERCSCPVDPGPAV